MRCPLVKLIVGAALGGVAAPAWGLLQVCTVASAGVAFGAYNPASASPLAGSGTVTVTCSLGLLTSWTISLNAGANGTFAGRTMSSGGATLAYNLFTSASHTVVWGDGTAGTGTVSDSQLLAAGSFPYGVYGQITALQDKPAGAYSDLITVTVNYN